MRNSDIFICEFIDSNDRKQGTKALEQFKESMGFSMDDPEHVYFWLQFMKAYFKQISEEEQIMFLQKFENFIGFNISMSIKYLKEVAEMTEDQLSKVPLYLNISLTLLNFVARLQQHYYDEEKAKSIKQLEEKAKVELPPVRENRTEVDIENLIDFGSGEINKEESKNDLAKARDDAEEFFLSSNKHIQSLKEETKIMNS